MILKKPGEMDLKFISQRHNKKLKERGIGLDVASTIMMTRASTLWMFNGINLPSFINGCKLKHYYGPLTLEVWLTSQHQDMEVKLKKLTSETHKKNSKDKVQLDDPHIMHSEADFIRHISPSHTIARTFVQTRSPTCKAPPPRKILI